MDLQGGFVIGTNGTSGTKMYHSELFDIFPFTLVVQRENEPLGTGSYNWQHQFGCKHLVGKSKNKLSSTVIKQTDSVSMHFGDTYLIRCPVYIGLSYKLASCHNIVVFRVC